MRYPSDIYFVFLLNVIDHLTQRILDMGNDDYEGFQVHNVDNLALDYPIYHG